jgi:DNA polymerase III alpha subunit
MLEGAMEPKTIAERAAKLDFPAVALADRNGLYGVMPFSEACFAKGVQPIIGTMLALSKAMPTSASWSRRHTSTVRSSRYRTLSSPSSRNSVKV